MRSSSESRHLERQRILSRLEELKNRVISALDSTSRPPFAKTPLKYPRQFRKSSPENLVTAKPVVTDLPSPKLASKSQPETQTNHQHKDLLRIVSKIRASNNQIRELLKLPISDGNILHDLDISKEQRFSVR